MATTAEATGGPWSAVEVLTRAGSARDGFRAAIGTDVEVDARLVSDLLRVSGRVGATLETRRALVELCGLVRAMDAAEAGRIDPGELRRGLEVHSGRTDGFAQFHDARVLLRTLAEVLGAGRAEADDPRPVLAQLAWLHRDLRCWLLEQLTGDAGGQVTAPAPAPAAAVADPREPWRIAAPEERRRADARVEDLLHGAAHHPITGLLGAAWVRGWYAAPVPGDRLGDDRAELARMATAAVAFGWDHVLQVARARPPRWTLDGDRLRVGDDLRPSWRLPATADGLALAARERPGPTIVTSFDDAFAYVEADGHHLVLGPADVVEAIVGATPLEAIAAFRDHVDSLADEDGDPPSDLLAVAMACGRLRRRSR
ncbi:MAG: hypothetical protein JWM98_140 [Thermoleophilia bacterium]|nr:hypothetical protein [Thermoleophilia bacterium]